MKVRLTAGYARSVPGRGGMLGCEVESCGQQL